MVRPILVVVAAFLLAVGGGAILLHLNGWNPATMVAMHSSDPASVPAAPATASPDADDAARADAADDATASGPDAAGEGPASLGDATAPSGPDLPAASAGADNGTSTETNTADLDSGRAPAPIPPLLGEPAAPDATADAAPAMNSADAASVAEGDEGGPELDVVRVEPTGEALIAGRGEPDSDIEILADGIVVAQTRADATGAFIAIPDAPLAPGGTTISARSRGDGDSVPKAGREVAIVVPGDEDGEGTAVATAGADGGDAGSAPEGSVVAMADPASGDGEPSAPEAAVAATPPAEPAAGAGESDRAGGDGSRIASADQGAGALGPAGGAAAGTDVQSPELSTTPSAAPSDSAASPSPPASAGPSSSGIAAGDEAGSGTASGSGPAAIGPSGGSATGVASRDAGAEIAGATGETAGGPAGAVPALRDSMGASRQPVPGEAGSESGDPAEPAPTAIAGLQGTEPSLPGASAPSGPTAPSTADAAAGEPGAASGTRTATADAPAAAQPGEPASGVAGGTGTAGGPGSTDGAGTEVATIGPAEPAGAAGGTDSGPDAISAGAVESVLDTEENELALVAVETEGQTLYVAGEATPGAQIRVFADDQEIGETRAGPEGRWLLQAEQPLDAPQVVMRAEELARSQVEVAASTELEFVRYLDTDILVPAASALPSNVEASGGGIAAPEVVIIRRGDTLWQISRRNYGRGIRYKTIFSANRDDIRNPHWIYPGQVFVVPKRDRSWEQSQAEAPAETR